MSSLSELLGQELQGKTGTLQTFDALQGKSFVMLYFSAHWCPPCRGFTPKLADKYRQSAAQSNIEVVFVSSDRDQASCDQYFGEMPWVALPFAARDLKESLSKKYGVKGIPTLVVLDGAGNLVTTEGRAEVDKYFIESGFSGVAPGDVNISDGGAGKEAASSPLATLLGAQLQAKSGTVKTDDALLGKAFIMVYFSAHWCPPCRGFTPVLAAKYRQSAAQKNIEVVFASSDTDQAAFDQYFGEMPWLSLPFAAQDLKEALSTKFEVQGIPTLVVLDGAGNLVTTEGRAEVEKYFGSVGSGACKCCSIM